MGLNVLIYFNNIPDAQLTQQVAGIEVYEKIDENTQYKLSFMVDVCDDDIATNLASKTDPGKLLTIMVQNEDQLVCLVKGPVTKQETYLQHGGAGSWIHVEGEDTGVLMSHQVNFQVHSNVSDADVVTQLLASQQNEPMDADIEATDGVIHKEDEHDLVQKEADLPFIRNLARRNGYHFWITYSNLGLSTGHFRSRNLDGDAAATLIINQDTYNVDSLKINTDTLRPAQVVGKQVDLKNKAIIDAGAMLSGTSLGKDNLSDVSGSNVQSMHLSAPVDSTGAAQARSTAVLNDTQWFINATCKTNTERLCSTIIRLHTVVNVQGAGSRFSGKYYVTGVKHTIDEALHIMELELARNAWGI